NVDSRRSWINPCLGAVGAAVAKGARGEHGGDALRRADNAPAQAPAVAVREAGLEAAGLDGGHELDGLRLEVTLAVQLAAAQAHWAKAGVIGGGGKKTAVGRWEAVPARRRFAVEETDVGHFQITLVGAPVRLGETRQLLLREIEGGIFHPQRVEEPPL